MSSSKETKAFVFANIPLAFVSYSGGRWHSGADVVVFVIVCLCILLFTGGKRYCYFVL